jgi:ligand-binding sensor domain-containing protein
MKENIFLFITINLFLLNSTGYAQNPEWINYTAGYPLYSILCNDDNVWVGSFGGLVKLNKTTEDLSFYTRASAGIPGNHISSLALDSSKNLWIGTYYEGVGKFEGVTCTVYNTHNSSLPHDQWNTAIATDSEGRILIGSQRWLVVIDGNNWKTFEAGSPVSSNFQLLDIEFDIDGNAWLGTTNGLGRFVGDTVIQQYAGIRNEIRCLALDRNDTLWIGTAFDGLWKFDGQSYVVFDTTNSGLPSNHIGDMQFDAQGTLWLATPKGLTRFDGNEWIVYNKLNSDVDQEGFNSLEIDDDGIVWLGKFIVPSLYRFDGTNWKKYEISNSGLLSNLVKSSFPDARGNRWITDWSQPNQLIRFDGTRWEYHDTTESQSLDSFFNRIYDDGSRIIWADSAIAISCSSATGWTMDNIGSPHSAGRFKVDKQGNLWEVSSQGLRRFDGQKWTVFNTSNTPLPTNSVVRVAFDDQENVWLTTLPNPGERGYLVKCDGTNWTTEYTCDIVHWIPALEISPTGNIWFGISDRNTVGTLYGGGLVRYDGTNWTNYTISNSGLPSNSVVTLAVDDEENVWVGTYGGGLAKFDGTSQWTVYDVWNSGLPGDNVELIGIDAMNNKWLGVQFSGLAIFREGGIILTDINENENRIPPSCFLEQNYPNPFNPLTQIRYRLPSETRVCLKIYDVLGKETAVLVDDEIKPQGWHTVTWNARDKYGNSVASGIYFCRLVAGTYAQAIKLALLR